MLNAQDLLGLRLWGDVLPRLLLCAARAAALGEEGLHYAVWVLRGRKGVQLEGYRRYLADLAMMGEAFSGFVVFALEGRLLLDRLYDGGLLTCL